MRVEGFYWATPKLYGPPQIIYLVNMGVGRVAITVSGRDRIFSEDDFLKIDERPLVREPEPMKSGLYWVNDTNQKGSPTIVAEYRSDDIHPWYMVGSNIPWPFGETRFVILRKLEFPK